MKTLKNTLILVIIFLPLWMTAQGVWNQKADYPGQRRFNFFGYALNNKGYMGSGTYGGMNSFLADMEEFDPQLNTWTQKAPLPMAFSDGVGFVAGNFGYATCGANDATYIFDTYEYNQAGNNWSSKALFDIPRMKAAATGTGNFGYIIGGYDGMALPMNDCWEYNQSANTWSQKASLPAAAARYYATAFSVNGLIYVFGGTDGGNMLNDLWQFNPGTNSWTQKASLPGAGRQQADIFVINNSAYVVGGFPASMAPLKECWKYNPANDQWTALNDFPGATGLAGGAGFAINGLGYVVSGNGTRECWEYTPATTGVEDLQVAQAATVFPNPATDRIRVKLHAGTTVASVSIYATSGKLMMDKKSVENSERGIDVSALSPGFYIINVITNSGTTENGSFIKIGN